jgi:hypothetical protein
MSVAVEETNIVLIDELILREALDWVSGCENCETEAVHSFDYILDATTDADPTITEYILCRPAMCPQCSGHITEKTRIRIG